MRLAALIGWFLALWGAAMLLVPTGTLRDMGALFTKAALFTFGGAYAVLPYVYQGAVEHYGWLTGSQMIDGLALGETTPGPLIMVVAFVGFIGASTQEVFGPDHPLLAGVAGAGVATFLTFLPSFLFILCGAPLVEATHGEVHRAAHRHHRRGGGGHRQPGDSSPGTCCGRPAPMPRPSWAGSSGSRRWFR